MSVPSLLKKLMRKFSMGVWDSIITIVATEASSYLDVVMVMGVLLMMMILTEF